MFGDHLFMSLPPIEPSVPVDGGAAGRLTSASGMGTGLLGQVGGAETHALITAEIPAVPFSGTTGSENTSHTHSYSAPAGASPVQAGTGITVANPSTSLTTGGDNNAHQHAFSGAISGGGGAHINVQPTIVANRLLRII
jgi:microcystin-dependent protein